MVFNNSNKIGRFLNSHVKSHDVRTGQCRPNECETLDGQKGAACCKLGIICPSLSGINCSAYNTRPRNCIVFPHIPEDLNLVKNCGYSFDTSTVNRALNGFDTITIDPQETKLQTNKPQNMKAITRETFKTFVETIDMSVLNQDDKETIELLKSPSGNYTDWNKLDADKELSAMVDELLDDLNKKYPNIKLSITSLPITEIEMPKEIKNDTQAVNKAAKAEKKPKAIKEKKAKPVKPAYDGELVETVLPQVRIIKRYVGMDKKKMTTEKILSFIVSLQKMIRSHAIHKTSKYADEINHIQKELIKLWKYHKGSRAQFLVELTKSDAKVLEAYRAIGNSQKPMQSIRVIKQYLSIQGKTDVKEKAKVILANLTTILATGAQDTYWTELRNAQESLKDYLDGKTDVPELSEQALNGFHGLGLIDFDHDIDEGDLVRTFDSKQGRVTKVTGRTIQIDTNPGHYYAKAKTRLIEKKTEKPCACAGAACLNGVGQVETVNSTEFAKQNFQTVGFTGKWLQLIGDPAEPWKMMVWSKPGKGKSSLMIEFAKYLASAHNRTCLFCANEEGFGLTLQDKFTRMNAFDPNISISQVLPTNLGQYNYVFIDSVTSFKLSITDLEDLIKAFPSTCFVFIYQSTIDGGYRGNKEVEHLVDVSVYINELGYATAQKTRYGGKGTVNVFPDGDQAKIYKFTTLQDAEKFILKLESTFDAAMVQGDDGKIWVTDKGKAQELANLGFQIIK